MPLRTEAFEVKRRKRQGVGGREIKKQQQQYVIMFLKFSWFFLNGKNDPFFIQMERIQESEFKAPANNLQHLAVY